MDTHDEPVFKIKLSLSGSNFETQGILNRDYYYYNSIII